MAWKWLFKSGATFILRWSFWCGDDGDGNFSVDYKDADDEDGEVEYKEEPGWPFGAESALTVVSTARASNSWPTHHMPNIHPMYTQRRSNVHRT